MFGEDSVPKTPAGDTVTVTVDNKQALVALSTMKVSVFLKPLNFYKHHTSFYYC